MRGMVDDISGNLLPSAVEGFSDVLETTFDALSQAATDQASQLGDRAEEMMSNLMEHVESEVMDAIQELFMRMIQEAIQEMITTIVECTVQMGIGSSITGAISPWLPALMVVKEVVEFIKMLMDAF
jgi:hypothetical protein